ncbi:MAG: efflux RND transporter periplasmic adaptor subunit [Gammaproteobacteria bacterium]|nr:efflux RND transporter periplasmic adaptor subunit [Gammaproteobacteria bacterium]
MLANPIGAQPSAATQAIHQAVRREYAPGSPIVSNADLLKELRIERSQREADPAGVPRRIRVLLALLLLAGVAAGAVWWWSTRPLQVRTVVASAPSKGESGAVLQATGYVTARRQATVSAQIIGTLTEVLIEEGDKVRKGQVLARLEDSSQRAQLDSARDNALAATAQVAQIRTQLAQAERDRARAEDLAHQKLIAVQQAEQARTQVEALRAQLNAAEAQAQSVASQVEVAQVNFNYTVVRAPFAGVITQKAAQVGEIIAPAAAGGGFTRTGVGTIVDMDSLEIDVDVNEAYIGRVSAGMPAEAVLDAYSDWTIPAHVIAIVPTADRGKATVKVRVAIDAKDARIVPDMGVRVSFLERSATQGVARVPRGVLVPASAIVVRNGRSVVFSVEGDIARERAVTPATQTYGELRLIPDGLAAGTRLVDQPSERISEGTRVTGK